VNSQTDTGRPDERMPAMETEQLLLAVVGDLVRELHPQRARFMAVAPSSRLERDLGIDSLGRTELILRIERAFRVRLPVETVGEADTVGNLLAALGEARPQYAHGARTAAVALPSVAAADEAGTLTEVLDWHCAHHPDRVHLTVLQDDQTEIGTLTYTDLADRARTIARGLIARDIVPGDRVALMLPTSLDFFAAFFGLLYAGAVPVPIYPPMRLSQLEDHLRRQAGILDNAGARLLIAPPEAGRVAGLLSNQVPSLDAVVSVEDIARAAAPTSLPAVTDPEATALIQYTSGSTGDPKGVVLTHANLLANVRAMGEVMEASSDDVFVSWLPLYHDMGLIGAWLGCLHFAAPLYVMSPLSFLIRPESWLWAMHRYRATYSAAPNFGYELCINKIDDADLEGLDLSSLRMLANGAEPVSVQTLRRFTAKFEPLGLPPGALAPVYGLAENAVGLAFPPLGRPPLVDRVDREAMSRRGIAEPASPDDANPLEIVACGRPLPGHDVRIVDESGHEVGDRREGRLEFRGPSATSGYFRNEAKTATLFADGWLDSGDRAYMAEGDIFITGRVKDIIIRAGRHLYPQEIEEAVAGVAGVRKGGVAVFGVTDRASGTERVVVLAETLETAPAARAALEARLHDVVTGLAGTPPDEIVLAPPRSVPKTSSGKIRRSAARELYETGRIGAGQRALWWQFARLAAAGIGPQAVRLCRLAGGYLYAGWWWLTVACGMALGWLAIMILPRVRWRWAAIRAIARTVLAAMAVPLTGRGIERIAGGGAMLTFNHSSYADVLVLTALLPGEPAFVAKKELSEQMFAGPVLRRLAIPFVERYDVAASLADAEALVALAREGRVLVFFPEGTFTRRAGLLGFYLGAFKVAADAGLPILPGIIRGTRSMLRANQWFPRRVPIAVEIAEPVVPAGADFASVLALRDAVRAEILARCGEPDLGEIVKPQA
jgi:1-acyl-sn-glycerol-3-phosphate acyltransferase